MAKLKYGLRVPAVQGLQPAELKTFVREAEVLGFHSIWAGDHVFYRTEVLQPLQLLSWIAALTERVRLGTAVMLTAYLNPVLLAKAAASLDFLSGGRLTLGLSIGGSEAEYKSIGVPQAERVGRLLETTRIMRRLWSEDGVKFEGKYNQVVDGTINPKPLQRPGIPVYFGATGEPMLRRLAGIADGWVGSAAGDIDGFLKGIETVRTAAAAKGRDPDSLGFAKLQSVSVAVEATDAVARAERHWKHYYGPNFDISRNVIAGTPQAVGERLARFGDATCETVTLVMEPSDLGPEQLERLKEATEIAAA